MGHRTSGPRDLDTCCGEAFAGLVDVGNTDREMAKRAAQIIRLGLIPVMGQFDHRIVVLVAVADKSQGELAGRIVAFSQQLHP